MSYVSGRRARLPRSTELLAGVVALATGAVGCGGNEVRRVGLYDGGPVVDTGVTPDAGVAPPPEDGGVAPVPDAGPPPTVSLSGQILKLEGYLRGQTEYSGGVEVKALGVEELPAVYSADADGAYALQLPQNGKVVVRASKAGYRSTYTELTVAAAPITGKNFYLAADEYVQRIGDAHQVNVLVAQPCHAPLPTNLSCRYAVVMGRVVDDGSYDNGTPTPLAGVTAADFTVKGEGDPAWYKKGPYFLSYDGQPGTYTETQRQRDPVTNKYRGGLYVVFVEVPVTGNPPKEFEISISSYAGGATRRQFGPVLFKALNGGLSWVTVAESGPGLPPEPPPITDVDFETEVYPLLAKVTAGGLGCLGCHTNEGGVVPSGGFNLYGGPAAAYAALNPASYPNRVNLASPAASTLLTKPLYEANGVQDHPIFAFVSEADPAYRLIHQWIVEGGVYEGQVAPPPVSFYNDVRPLLYRPDAEGGIGCYTCHVSGVDANTAPGGLYFGGTPQELYNELTQERAIDNGLTGEQYRINKVGNAANSLMLLNPLVGCPEPHPAKILNGANDPRYQTLYRWITEGYANDTP